LSLTVRAASTGDAAQLYGLIQDHASFERTTASLTELELKAIIASSQPPTWLVVAESKGAIVGYFAVSFDWSLWRARPYGHLDCLFVAEDVRGKGVGAKLLDAAVWLASRERADRLEWQTPAWNKDAIRFYLRQGAEGADKKRFALKVNRSD
jgi:GNAT superfamily N-acetyltransferase